MDYLEGALLGSLWSDTDFENTRHRGAALWLSVAFWLLGGWFVKRANLGSVFHSQPIFWAILLFVLILVSPLLSYIYYDVGVLARLGILLTQTVKYGSVYFLLYSLVVPHLIVSEENLFDILMKRYDNVISGFLENSNILNSMNGLVTAVIILAVAVVLLMAIAILFLAFFPSGMLRLTALAQHLFDILFLRITKNKRQNEARKTKSDLFSGKTAEILESDEFHQPESRDMSREVRLHTIPGISQNKQKPPMGNE
ncbi:MAG: hypothetical protein ACOX2M_02025 [Fastidiosipilaceae bacterium]|jgi:hypothetical protein